MYCWFVQGCCLQAVRRMNFWICFFLFVFVLSATTKLLTVARLVQVTHATIFWVHNVVDNMSIVSSIEKAKFSGVVYRDTRLIKYHKEFGVGKVRETDAGVSVFFSNISRVYCWCPRETFSEGSAIP